MNHFKFHTVKTRLNSTLDGRRFIRYESTPQLPTVKGGWTNPKDSLENVAKEKNTYIRLFAGM
jgi:hypothetical protein